MREPRSFTESLAEARAGNSSELNELLELARPALRQRANGYLGKKTSRRADSSDLVQETMTQAFSSFRYFRGTTETEWHAWLRSVMRIRAAKIWRFHHTGKRDVNQECGMPAGSADAGSSGPFSQLIQMERFERLFAALEQLPSPMQDVIRRRIFEQESLPAIARSIGRSEGATRQLLARGIRKLRDSMAAENEDG